MVGQRTGLARSGEVSFLIMGALRPVEARGLWKATQQVLQTNQFGTWHEWSLSLL